MFTPIRSSLSLTSFLLKHPASGEERSADLKDISLVGTEDDVVELSQSTDWVRLSSEQWQQAKKREAIIRPLAELMTVPATLTKQAAKTRVIAVIMPNSNDVAISRLDSLSSISG